MRLLQLTALFTFVLLATSTEMPPSISSSRIPAQFPQPPAVASLPELLMEDLADAEDDFDMMMAEDFTEPEEDFLLLPPPPSSSSSVLPPSDLTASQGLTSPHVVLPPALLDLLPTLRSQTCRDYIARQTCLAYRRRGFCRRASFKRRCRQSCTGCKTTATSVVRPPAPTPSPVLGCQDTSTSCPRWARRGYCKRGRHLTYMRRVCRGTCKLCKREYLFATTILPPVKERYTGKCGITKVPLRYTFSYKVVGGGPSLYGALPWQVAIYNTRGEHTCGGVLISDQHIVTAAHCFKTDRMRESYVVKLGKYHRKMAKRDRGELVVKLEEISVHPEYNDYANNNDIALLKLIEPVEFTNFIRPICLPNPLTELKVNMRGLISGWGDTKDASNRNDVLQQVDVRLIEMKTCDRWMSSVRGGGSVLTDNMFCAGFSSGGKDACQGDSGGPLIIEEDGRHTLVGVISWGYGCARKNSPGVYTKVGNYLHWLQGNMK